MTIEYNSKRSEVMTWYWWTWRSNPRMILWRVLIFLGAAATFLVASGASETAVNTANSTSKVLPAVFTGFGSLAFLAVFPMLMFKSQKRTLTTDAAGITTTIGKRSGSLHWKQIARVVRHANFTVIEGRNGNAFIVPPRAFANEQQQKSFEDEAIEWLKSARQAT